MRTKEWVIFKTSDAQKKKSRKMFIIEYTTNVRNI